MRNLTPATASRRVNTGFLNKGIQLARTKTCQQTVLGRLGTVSVVIGANDGEEMWTTLLAWRFCVVCGDGDLLFAVKEGKRGLVLFCQQVLGLALRHGT